MKKYPLTIPACQLDENNYFIGMTVADLDPRDENHGYILPARCILADEPAIKAGFKAKWTDSDWEYIEDHRDETVYDKDTRKIVKIDYLGKLDKTLTTIPPRPYTVWSEKDNNWIEKENAEELKTADELNNKKLNAGTINRAQFLTEIELQTGKNKDQLIALISKKVKGVDLIVLKNTIAESQNFTLSNEYIWNLLIQILGIKVEEIFDLWEDAKKY